MEPIQPDSTLSRLLWRYSCRECGQMRVSPGVASVLYCSRCELPLVPEILHDRNLQELWEACTRHTRFSFWLAVAPDFRFEVPEPPASFANFRADLETLGYYPILRRRGERIVCHLRPDEGLRAKPGGGLAALALFLLTALTVVIAGHMYSDGYSRSTAPSLNPWAGAAWFAAALLTILGVHEAGHLLAARWTGTRVGYPWFIFGVPPAGTFGAILRMRALPPNRSAAAWVGVGGPLAGFVASLPFLILGILKSPEETDPRAPVARALPAGSGVSDPRPAPEATPPVRPLPSGRGAAASKDRAPQDPARPAPASPPPPTPEMRSPGPADLPGGGATASSAAGAPAPVAASGPAPIPGAVAPAPPSPRRPADGTHCEPLIYRAAQWLVRPNLPEGRTLRAHPVLLAAWVGLLLTFLQLIPMGQLDGGHVLRACMDARSFRNITAGLGLLGLVAGSAWSGWYIWGVFGLAFAFLGGNPGSMNELDRPSRGVWVPAGIALALLILCFMPVPWQG